MYDVYKRVWQTMYIETANSTISHSITVVLPYSKTKAAYKVSWELRVVTGLCMPRCHNITLTCNTTSNHHG